MTRAVFNTDCDVFLGPGTSVPGLFVGTFNCRLVIEDGITAVGLGSPVVPAYLTIEDYQPTGAWTSPFFGMNPALADRIAIPSGTAIQYWVLLTDDIDWMGQHVYHRSYLVALPAPDIEVTGGAVGSGLATISFVPVFLGSGGAVGSGEAIATKIMAVTGSGGAEGNSSGTISIGSTLVTLGGAEGNSAATFSYTPNPYYVRDTFTDTNGTNLTSHTPEVRGPWSVILGGFQIISNSCQATTYSGGTTGAGIDSAHTAYTLTADGFVPGGNNLALNYWGIMVRFTDLSNCIYAYMFNGFLYLQEISGGALIQQQFTNAGMVAGNTYTMVIVLTTGGVSATCNGSGLSLTTTLSNTVTGLGLFISAAGGSNIGTKIDNFVCVP